MRRVILTTCGTSLFTSNCWKDHDLSAEPALSKAAAENKPRLEKRYRDYTIGHKEDTPTGQSLADVFDEQIWNTLPQIAKLPAELASLRVIIEALSSKGEALNKNDMIILLHSDNDDGRYCAMVLEQVLNNLLQNIDIDIERNEIKGLDPVDPKRLLEALQHIWRSYSERVKGSGLSFIYNLTGGYKATSMILAAQAAVLSEAANITVAYLHEDAPTDILFSIHWDLNDPKFGFWSKNNNSSLLPAL